MVFRRRGLNPIQSVKHIVDAEGTTTEANDSVTVFTKVVNARSAVFDPTECVLGETIRGVFITVFAIGSTGAPIDGSVNWYIAKARSGQNSLTDFPDAGNTGISNLRSQIIHEEKGVPGSGDGTPMVFKGVIAIPPNMRRQRDGDAFFFRIGNTQTGGASTFCFKAIYKSFS